MHLAISCGGYIMPIVRLVALVFAIAVFTLLAFGWVITPMLPVGAFHWLSGGLALYCVSCLPDSLPSRT